MVILPPNHLFATNEIANKKSTRHHSYLPKIFNFSSSLFEFATSFLGIYMGLA